ncbi:hypothetical protein A9996_06135 [Gelidibacter algens]|nr:hypothetical protein A9996_06135 [Gelidibacter algens]
MNFVMVFVTLIVTVPFIWFVLAEKSGASKKKKAFNDAAKGHNIKFTLKEAWNNTCLGFDEQENTLFYININTAETKVQKVALEDVRKCVINKTSKEYKNGDKHYSEMSRLDLEFTFVSNTNPVVITLYNAEDNFSQNREVARAEKWLSIIDKHKHNKNNVIAA